MNVFVGDAPDVGVELGQRRRPHVRTLRGGRVFAGLVRSRHDQLPLRQHLGDSTFDSSRIDEREQVGITRGRQQGRESRAHNVIGASQ